MPKITPHEVPVKDAYDNIYFQKASIFIIANAMTSMTLHSHPSI
jgi:hypothetical protein